MKMNFSQKLLDFDGKPLKDDTTNTPLTLSYICINALLIGEQTPIEGVEKLRRYELARAIHEGKKDSLSAEEVVLLKELIGKYFTTMVVGQVFPMLDSD